MEAGDGAEAVGTSRTEEAGRIGDPARLDAVAASGLAGRLGVNSLDILATVAARVLDAPLAFVTVVDDRRSWWVSSVGAGADPSVHYNTVDESFCQYVIADEAPVIIEDAAIHPRTKDNPSVRLMGVRAWAGFPLRSRDGFTIGSFCVVDTVPRRWGEANVELLGLLAEAASAQVAALAAAAAEMTFRDDAELLRSERQVASDRVQRLAMAALRLVAAETEEDLLEVIVDDGVLLLDAAGCGLVVCEKDDQLRAILSKQYGEYVPQPFGPPGSQARLPGREVARTGTRLLLPDRASGLAFSPDMADVYQQLGHSAWASLPLRVGHRLLGSVTISWSEERSFGPEDLGLLDGFAAQCSQALEHIRVLREERERSAALQHLSEALQQSLLTRPSTAETLGIAVRYRPAAEQAQVGGDWHDAFVTASGSTMVVVGDVTGHDGVAAAAMAQIRNVLRGMAYDSPDGPSALLTRLDRTLLGLEVDALATAVLAHVESVPEQNVPGMHRLRWCNAGHLPPLLRLPGGTVEVLAGEPELLLGLSGTEVRREMTRDLPPGAALLLYTDGLVEGRHASLEEGIDRLAVAFGAGDVEDLDDLCDSLLTADLGADNNDDVALLVLYCRPAVQADALRAAMDAVLVADPSVGQA